MASASGSLTTTLGSVTLTPRGDGVCLICISGTYGTVTFVIEGEIGGTWFPLVAVAQADGTIATSTISPSDNTTVAWAAPCANMNGVRLRATACASGTLVVTMQSTPSAGGSPVTASTTSSAGSGTTNITSSSATAFTVGLSGTTNPGFQVDMSTASAITGLKIKAAATGNGVALTSLGGTNELITIDTKGSGTLGINTLNNSAGLVTIGNSTNVCGATIVGPFTVNSSINQNVSINGGTSTGSITIGNTVAGAVSIQSASASILKVTGAGLTVGTLTSGTTAIVSAGLLTLTGVGASVWTPGAGATIVSDAGTGITFGTATGQKLGFYNATPVVQGAVSTNSATGTTGASTGVSIDTTFTGGSGATAYTIGGVILRLKQFGFLAA